MRVLATDLVAVSVDGLCELSNSQFQGMYLHVAMSTWPDLSQFFISRVIHLPNSIVYVISYSTLAVEIGRFSLNTDTHSPGNVTSFRSTEQLAAGYLEPLHKPPLTNFPIGQFDFGLEAARLSVGCVRPQVSPLTGIQISDGNSTSKVLRNDVRIRSGENIRLRTTSEGSRSVVYIDAIDTSDLRDSCGCGDEIGTAIRSLGVVRPDIDGNININGDECLELSEGKHSLSLTNPCSRPCCGCETAESLTATLKPLAEQVEQTNAYGKELDVKTTTLQTWVEQTPTFQRTE